MKEPHKTFLWLMAVVATGTLGGWYKGHIRGADVTLSIAFVGILWLTFGLPWAHSEWNRLSGVRWHRVAPRLFWTIAIIAVLSPFASFLPGVFITNYGSVCLDSAIVRVVSTPPSTVPVITLPRPNVPVVSKCVAPGPVCYVVAGTPTAVYVSPGAPVLAEVLKEVDSKFRIVPASFVALALPIAILFLWIVEIASDWRQLQGETHGGVPRAAV